MAQDPEERQEIKQLINELYDAQSFEQLSTLAPADSQLLPSTLSDEV